MGLFTQVFLPVASLRSVSVYPPIACHDPTTSSVIVTSRNALENAIATNSNGILAVPSFLEEWALSIDAVKQLSQFFYVVRILCFWHSTELTLSIVTSLMAVGLLQRRRAIP